MKPEALKNNYNLKASRRRETQEISLASSKEPVRFTKLQVLENETRNLAASIKVKEVNLREDKRRVIKNISMIYRDHYNELERKYQQDFAKYIEEVIEIQDRGTALSDAKIVEMLVYHKQEELLDLDISGIIYSLRRISYVRDKMDPKRGEQKQLELLGQLHELNREQLDQKIKAFKLESKLENYSQRDDKKAAPLYWKTYFDEKKQTIMVDQIIEREYKEKLLKLLREITPEKLDAVMEILDT